MSERTSWNRKTKEDFVTFSNEVHDGFYDYTKVIYRSSIEKVIITCPIHGDFLQTPKIHKKSSCPKCATQRIRECHSKGAEKFIEELIGVHGDVYNTEKVKYINTKTEIILGCEKHGDFTKTPSDLLAGAGCNKCKSDKSKYNNIELFIKESIRLFGDITDHSNVFEISARQKVNLRCTEHDQHFNISVSSRLAGQKCPRCAEENYAKLRRLSSEEYFNRAKVIHNNRYTYVEEYISSKYDITFFCKNHGKKTVNSFSHLQGCGCFECFDGNHKIDKIGKRGYVKLADGRETSLYLIKCFKGDEVFYKIGKTFRGLDKRFISSTMPYAYEIITQYLSDAETIFDLEEVLHKKYKSYKYETSIRFAGYTECYNINLPIQEIKDL